MDKTTKRKIAKWARRTWLGVLVVSGAFELYGVLDPDQEDTLSETTRYLFRTDSKWGRRAFLLFWAAFNAWFPEHIVGHPQD